MTLELFLTIFGATCALLGGFRWIAAIAMRQYEAALTERFNSFTTALEQLQRVGGERLQKLEAKCEALDQEVRRILIELPRDYVARTDYIRRETVMEAKIDQLGLRIENWVLKGTLQNKETRQ